MASEIKTAHPSYAYCLYLLNEQAPAVALPLKHVMYYRGMAPPRSYPSDVNENEWAFVAPYLTLLREDALQR